MTTREAFDIVVANAIRHNDYVKEVLSDISDNLPAIEKLSKEFDEAIAIVESCSSECVRNRNDNKQTKDDLSYTPIVRWSGGETIGHIDSEGGCYAE